MSSAITCQPLSDVKQQQSQATEMEQELIVPCKGLFKRNNNSPGNDVAMETTAEDCEDADHDVMADAPDPPDEEHTTQLLTPISTVAKLSEVLFSEEDIIDILRASDENADVTPPAIDLDESLPEEDVTNENDNEVVEEHSERSTEIQPCEQQITDDTQHRSLLEKRRSSSPQLSCIEPSDKVSMTRPQMVAKEIVFTERAYVNDLQEIIEGYLFHVFHHGPSLVDIEKIFCNLEEIFDFNKALLDELEFCSSCPAQVAECFVQKAKGFNVLYSQYCTSYPEAAAFLSEILIDNKQVSTFFQDRQKALGHALSIETYLLKPVQRITKYHLLFQDMFKHTKSTDPGAETIKAALDDMTDVADYINEMKRLQEDIVKAHDVLDTIMGIESLDVYKTGRLVLENSFRVQGYRGDRQLFLFEKLLLICKRVEDGLFHFKNGIMCSNMMLVESISKDPTAFRIIRFDNRKVVYNIQARTLDIKKVWVQHIKRLLLENHPALVPVTAKQAILGSSSNGLNRSKYNTISLDAHDDISEKIVRQQKSKVAVSNGKENRYSPSAGGKRDFAQKSEDVIEKEKKATLNSKARDFLDKKTKALHMVTSPDKTSRPWPRFRKSTKQTKNNGDITPDMSPRTKGTLLSLAKLSKEKWAAVARSKSMESTRSTSISTDEVPLSSSPRLNGNSRQKESSVDDAAMKQIHRLSMLHDLISIDLESSRADKPTTPTLAAEEVANDNAAEGNLPLMFDRYAMEDIPPLPASSPVIRRKQSRARPLSLLSNEGGAKKKPSDVNRCDPGVDDASTSLLLDCHSPELRNRLGSSRETMLIDDNEDSLDDSHDISRSNKAVDASADTTAQSQVNDGDEERRRAVSMTSDDESSIASLEYTIRRVNEAFSRQQSSNLKTDHAQDRPTDDGQFSQEASTVRLDDDESQLRELVTTPPVRPRARSAYASVDSSVIGQSDAGDDASDVESNPLSPVSLHARSNSEGNPLLTQRLDSVQSELDEACEDFSLVVAEMESPTRSLSESPFNRTPIRHAQLTRNDYHSTVDTDDDRHGNRAEAKVVHTRRRTASADALPSADSKRVSDRIRAYSCLMESYDVIERRQSCDRPRSQARLDELFESLDTSTEGVSPVYRSQRRRFSRKSGCGRKEVPPTNTAEDAMVGSRVRAASDLSHRVSESADDLCRVRSQTHSLPRHVSLASTADVALPTATVVESAEEPLDPTMADPSSDAGTSPSHDKNDSKVDEVTPPDEQIPSRRNRSWSQECGAIVTGPRHAFLGANTTTVSSRGSSSAFSMRSPSIRNIQRSIVHRRVKEYIENVIKPSERELPSARQRMLRNQRRRTSRIEEHDETDTAAAPVERGTVQRLRGKFSG